MPGDDRVKKNELAQRRTLIDLIGMVIEQFDRSLTDNHKIAMFAMPFRGLEILHRDLTKARSGLEVSRKLAVALATVYPFRGDEEKTPTKPASAKAVKTSRR